MENRPDPLFHSGQWFVIKTRHHPIVHADDDTEALTSMRTTLEADGLTVIDVTEAGRALEICQTGKVSLVISERNFKGMSGLELLQQIRAGKSTWWIPFIFYSTVIDRQAVIEALEAGADDYLYKPTATVPEIMTRVKRALKSNTRDTVYQQSPPPQE